MCVILHPLPLQEHVFQPYENLLPYEDFSIRLTNADLPRLREILRSVTEDEVGAWPAAAAVIRGAGAALKACRRSRPALPATCLPPVCAAASSKRCGLYQWRRLTAHHPSDPSPTEPTTRVLLPPLVPQYRRMMQALLAVRPAFSWVPWQGGRAFDYTIAALRRRYLHLKAAYF